MQSNLSGGNPTALIPVLSISNPTIDATANTATFTVTRSGDIDAHVTVNYATSDGTAKNGIDYTGMTGTLDFAPNTTTQQITIHLLNSGGNGGTFSVSLTTASNAATGALQPNTGAVIDPQQGAATATIKPVSKSPTTTTVISSYSSSVFGQSVTFNATVSAGSSGGTPTGTVVFLDVSTTLGQATLGSNGKASFATSGLAVGNHAITASYTGDNAFAGSVSTALPQAVGKASTSTMLNPPPGPLMAFQSVALTAAVSVLSPGAGTPTGKVQFIIDGTPYIEGISPAGTAIFTSGYYLGPHTISASYLGDADFLNSASTPFNLVVGQVSATVISSANPSVFGQSVTFTASLSSQPAGGGPPTGTVQFVIDGDNTGSPANISTTGGVGTAIYSTSSLAGGTHTVSASYSGDTNYLASTGMLLGGQTVDAVLTSTKVTSLASPSVFGQSVTFTATVMASGGGALPLPTGNIQFVIDGTDLGSAISLANGMATSAAVGGLTVGDHIVQAYYSGDPNFLKSSVSIKQTVVADASLITSTADSGPGTLRYALLNALPGATLHFQAGLTGVITLATGTLTIDQDVTIAGPGAAAITISGNSMFEVFQIAPGVTATISGLTVANGSSSGDGGGISNQGTLTLIESTFSGNFAGDRGGGVYNSSSGTMILSNSIVSGNSATDAGGGIYNAGTLKISYTSLSGNGGNGADGGGIFNEGTLGVTGSTLSSNGDPAAYGGAIRNDGALSVVNSTFSGNSANLGGAIFNNGGLVLTSTTIAGNQAALGGGGIDVNNGVLTALDTIFADNTLAAGSGPDISGMLASLGHNLIGNTDGGSGFVASDLLNINPLLGPLQDNGGPTQTMALLPGSPAVDAGDNTGAPDYDQRGPGFPRIVGGTIDIGALEVQPGPVSSLLLATPAQIASNTPFDVTITVLDAYGHVAVNYQGTISFSTSDGDPGVVLPATYTFTFGDAGSHTFTVGVSLVTEGNQTLSVADMEGLMGSITITVI